MRARAAANERSVEPIDFCSATPFDVPFRHFMIRNFLSAQPADAMLSWLEQQTRWNQREIADFYETYDINLYNAALPSELQFFVQDDFLDFIRGKVTELLLAPKLAKRVDVAAHKLVPGYKVKIHTDYGPTGQSQRLLIQLNRGWSAANGGILMLFDEEFPNGPSERHKYYLPHHRCGFGFRISPQSFHAVSPVVSGDRYTLSFSFYDEAGAQTEKPHV
jgi:Rps23 Pro-64 3,4-dihydroxylase Tpa1-like proline 4-hydroxylase